MRTFAAHFVNLLTARKGTMPVSASSPQEAREKFLAQNQNPHLKLTAIRRPA